MTAQRRGRTRDERQHQAAVQGQLEPDSRSGLPDRSAYGKPKRRQKWVTFRGTKKEAQTQLTELLRSANRGEFIERSKLTLGEWLNEWLEKAIKRPAKRASTYRAYKHVIEHRVKPVLGTIRLQDLKAADIKRYYTDSQLSASTLAQHHAIVSAALKAATLENLVTRNVAALVIGKPQAHRDHDALRRNCWEPVEARSFLSAARAAGAQPAALYALALDSGARKNELCGLQWSDVDLENGMVTFVRQLTATGRTPEFGPVKNGTPRTVDLGPETIELLRTLAERRLH
jgi:integrase